MGSIPTIGSRKKAPVVFFPGCFYIGVLLFKTFLKRTLTFLLTLFITAGLFSAFFTEKVSADSPYKLSGTSIAKTLGYSIGEFDSGILTLGKRESGKGLQAINVNLSMNDKTLSGSLEYRIYVNKKGWQPWTSNSMITGLLTMPNQISGVEMRLTGDLAKEYGVWYAAWTDLHKDRQGWVCDGAQAGSPSEARRIEELRVMIVKRDQQFGSTGIHFRSYMQKYGWGGSWTYSNHYTGRPGKNLRMEAIELYLTSTEYTGGISYRVMVSGASGWQPWKYDGEYAGTVKQNKRMEAIEIRLTGDVASQYDIYYRTYINGLGWFNWSKNGEAAGARGIGRRIEAIQIALVRKGNPAPSALNKIRTKIGYKYVSTSASSGVSDWKITSNGNSNGFASKVLKRAKHYNRTEYKDMRCDALVAQVLIDALGTDLGKASKKSKYARLNEWIGLSALESLLSSNFTYKDSSGRTVICRPVAQTKLKPLVKRLWNKKELRISEEDFNNWITTYCKPGDIVIFYNKHKKPIHCGIYSGIQQGSAKEYEYFRGKNKGEKDSDIKPGPYMWHSGSYTGVANKYAYWVADVGDRTYYCKRFRVDSGKSQPAAPKQS